MTRSPTEAIAWGRAQAASGSTAWFRLCLSFVRQAYGIAAVHPSAIAAWYGAGRKHHTSDPNSIPVGVPVFWSIGKHGHVALTSKKVDGVVFCLSNDIEAAGRISEVPVDVFRTRWGAGLLGWTEDLNGVTVVPPARKKKKAALPLPKVRAVLRRKRRKAKRRGNTKRVAWLNRVLREIRRGR